MPTYVQGPNSDTWHWCTNCTNYASTIVKREVHAGRDRPRTGELDNQCLSKEREGTCRA